MTFLAVVICGKSK